MSTTIIIAYQILVEEISNDVIYPYLMSATSHVNVNVFLADHSVIHHQPTYTLCGRHVENINNSHLNHHHHSISRPN